MATGSYADYNGIRQDGFNYFQLTQKNGLRHSSYQAFIAPILKRRRNLNLLSAAHVLALAALQMIIALIFNSI